MNIVTLVGRITRDVELHNNNTAVAKFSVAVDRRFKKEGEPTADFINCVAFGKTAEIIEKYFKKGSRIGVVGRIQTGSYTNKDGNKVYTTDVVVDGFDFLDSKSGSNNATAVETTPADVLEEALKMPPITEDKSFAPAGDVTDDDLPF